MIDRFEELSDWDKHDLAVMLAEKFMTDDELILRFDLQTREHDLDYYLRNRPMEDIIDSMMESEKIGPAEMLAYIGEDDVKSEVEECSGKRPGFKIGEQNMKMESEVQSVLTRKRIKQKRYGSSIALTLPRWCGGFANGFYINGSYESSRTVVFHLWNSTIHLSLDSYVEQLKEILPDVCVTQGEVDGMWENRKHALRIYVRDAIQDTTSVAHDLSVAVRNIGNALLELSSYLGHPEFLKEYDNEALINLYSFFDLDSHETTCTVMEEKVELPQAKKTEKVRKETGFKALAGMEPLKAQLSETVIWPLANREKAEKYRVTPPNGMLLYGPPGCGKTFFAERFAEETGFNYKLVKPSDLGSIFLHGSQGEIARFFNEAHCMAPCVICFDEVDALLPVRSSAPGESHLNGEVNEFLTQMNNCGKDGIFIIGTTNNKDLIDPAALRKGRLDFQVEISKPDALQRKALFEFELADRPVSEDIRIDTLVEASDGLVAADVAYIVNQAALKSAIKDEPITEERLMDAVSQCTKSKKEERKIGF